MPTFGEKYKIIRNKIVSLIRKSKMIILKQMDSLLSTETTDIEIINI